MPHPDMLYRTQLMRTLYPYLWQRSILSTANLDLPLLYHMVSLTDERDFQADLAEFTARCHPLTLEHINFLYDLWYSVTGCFWRFPALAYRTALMQEIFHWLWRDNLVTMGETEKEAVKKLIENTWEDLFKRDLYDFEEKHGKIKIDKLALLVILWFEVKGTYLIAEADLLRLLNEENENST